MRLPLAGESHGQGQILAVAGSPQFYKARLLSALERGMILHLKTIIKKNMKYVGDARCTAVQRVKCLWLSWGIWGGGSVALCLFFCPFLR